MKKNHCTFNTVYVLFTAAHTVKEGDIAIILSMDADSGYAFPPALAKKPDTDAELENFIEQFHTIIKDEHNPDKHADSTTFVTNIPEDIFPLIKNVFPECHIWISDEEATYQSMKPILDNLPFS